MVVPKEEGVGKVRIAVHPINLFKEFIMSRKSAAAAATSANVGALESAAIAAVKGIESSYGMASAAILAFVLGCKSAKVQAPVFDAGITRIAEAAPGLALISVRGYVSNARRIWACPADKLAEVMKTVSGLQSIAKACPAVEKTKAEGAKAREADKAEGAKAREVVKTEEKGVDVKAPSAPVVKDAAVDPVLVIANALVMLRKANANKRAVMSLIGEMEDMLDDLKKLAKVA